MAALVQSKGQHGFRTNARPRVTTLIPAANISLNDENSQTGKFFLLDKGVVYSKAKERVFNPARLTNKTLSHLLSHFVTISFRLKLPLSTTTMGRGTGNRPG